jgi:hypothetical protein
VSLLSVSAGSDTPSELQPRVVAGGDGVLQVLDDPDGRLAIQLPQFPLCSRGELNRSGQGFC